MIPSRSSDFFYKKCNANYKSSVSFFYYFVAEKPKLPEKKYYIDTNQIHLAKENMEIINPVKDGMSEY